MAEFFKQGKLGRIMDAPTHAYTSPDGRVSYKNGEGEVTVDPMGNLSEGAPVDVKWDDDSWIVENANLRVARYREEEFLDDEVWDEED